MVHCRMMFDDDTLLNNVMQHSYTNVTTVFTDVQLSATTYTHIQQCAHAYKHVVLMFHKFVTSSTDVQWSVMLFQLNATLPNNVTTMYNDVTTICNNGTTMYDNVCIVVTMCNDVVVWHNIMFLQSEMMLHHNVTTCVTTHYYNVTSICTYAHSSRITYNHVWCNVTMLQCYNNIGWCYINVKQCSTMLQQCYDVPT